MSLIYPYASMLNIVPWCLVNGDITLLVLEMLAACAICSTFLSVRAHGKSSASRWYVGLGKVYWITARVYCTRNFVARVRATCVRTTYELWTRDYGSCVLCALLSDWTDDFISETVTCYRWPEQNITTYVHLFVFGHCVTCAVIIRKVVQ